MGNPINFSLVLLVSIVLLYFLDVESIILIYIRNNGSCVHILRANQAKMPIQIGRQKSFISPLFSSY